MKVTVSYFAQLRECAGRTEETLETSSETALGLYQELSARYGFALTPQHMKVAINDRFAPFDAPLAQGDIVVFIAPISGG